MFYEKTFFSFYNIFLITYKYIIMYWNFDNVVITWLHLYMSEIKMNRSFF